MFPLPDKAAVLLQFSKTTSASQPLRVGVVYDGPSPLHWTAALLAFLGELPGLKVYPCALGGHASPLPKPPSALMSSLYAASRRKFDPFGMAAPGALAPATLDDCGVVIWLSSRQAPHGAFTVRLGGGQDLIPFWEEAATNQPTSTVSVLWNGRVVRTAELSTVQGLYFTQNAEEPLLAAVRMLAVLCLEIQQNGPLCEARFRLLPEEPVARQTSANYPSSLAAGQFLARKFLRSAVLRWRSRGKRTKWFVAIRPNAGGSIIDPAHCDLSGFREVPLPQGSEAIADPFLVEVNGRTWLLFEDMPAGVPRARLGAAEVLKDGSISPMTVVLERDCHLSYPCVVPAHGELFLLPDSVEARQQNLYRFTRFPDRTELVSTLLDQACIVDTTPFYLDDRWYFFTTTAQPFMESLLFHSSRLDGPWTLHPASPISGSVINSRGAGNLFMKNGRLYRPTQDCSLRYGYAITVNEVTRLTPTEFSERPVNRVLPSWAPGLLGTHTWNETSKFQVIDGIRWRP